MVGWDLPCEHLNAYLTHTVQGQVSPEAIDRAVDRYPLFQHNHSLLMHASLEHTMKEMEEDVQLLVAALKQHVGATWHAASKRARPARRGRQLRTNAVARRGAKLRPL